MDVRPEHVRRVRDSVLIAHRCARAFGRFRERSWAGASLAWLAYPPVWVAYMIITGWRASDTVHAGVASAIVPNPVSRPHRHRAWATLALAVCVVVVCGVIIAATPSPWHLMLIAAGSVSVLCALAEQLAMVRSEREAGSVNETEALLRPVVGERPLVRGASFAAWPQHTGAGGQLLRAVLGELRRDRVSLVWVARDDGLAATYVDTFGGTRPNSARPRHIAWLNPEPDEMQYGSRAGGRDPCPRRSKRLMRIRRGRAGRRCARGCRRRSRGW
jgi:hypothetical protein